MFAPGAILLSFSDILAFLVSHSLLTRVYICLRCCLSGGVRSADFHVRGSPVGHHWLDDRQAHVPGFWCFPDHLPLCRYCTLFCCLSSRCFDFLFPFVFLILVSSLCPCFFRSFFLSFLLTFLTFFLSFLYSCFFFFFLASFLLSFLLCFFLSCFFCFLFFLSFFLSRLCALSKQIIRV